MDDNTETVGRIKYTGDNAAEVAAYCKVTDYKERVCTRKADPSRSLTLFADGSSLVLHQGSEVALQRYTGYRLALVNDNGEEVS